ncbi:DegT/DnrJ/EryC1/StrS family aminotransferase [Nitrososphaera sp.]|uniref:DegT/DnrJ/EryC1/StrS family aminotransferase n=1 Tax=Nitrososphaera sp. TaxID=1971748 RepID=UPI003171E290
MSSTGKRINQFEPWFDEEEKKQLAQVIDSGWIQESKLTREFEKQYADFVGAKYAVSTTSGTIAIFMALKAYGIGPGDRVVVPDYTAIGTLNAVTLTGAAVDIVDVHGSDANMDPEAFAKAITPTTKAVIPVHINGRPAAMKRIMEIADKHGIRVIEDAAQCLGSKLDGKHLGTFVDMGCFSLATSKIITTGQGGMVVTSSEELFKKLVEVKDQGTTARLKSTTIPDWYEGIGFNFKFTDLQAAVGIAQFKKLQSRLKRRLEMHRLYKELLGGLADFIPTETSRGIVPWYDDILLKSTQERSKVMQHIKQYQIGSREFYRPLHTQPAYKREGNFENTILLSQRGMWLPSSTFLTDDEVKFVAGKVKEALT